MLHIQVPCPPQQMNRTILFVTSLLMTFLLAWTSPVKAQDGLGEQWEHTTNDLSNVGAEGFRNFAFNPSSGVFIAVTLNGVFRSTDAGESWTELTSLPSRQYVDVATDGNGTWILAAGLSAGVVYDDYLMSTDDGVNWQTVSFQVDNAAASDVQVTSVVYAKGDGSGLWLMGTPHGEPGQETTGVDVGVLASVDGLTWSSSNSWSAGSVFGMEVSSDGQVVMASVGPVVSTVSGTCNDFNVSPALACGVYRSTDGGQNFTLVQATDKNGRRLIQLAYSPDQDQWLAVVLGEEAHTVLWATDPAGSIFKDTGFDGHKDLQNTYRNLHSVAIGDDDAGNEIWLVGGVVRDSQATGLYRSADYGVTWNAISIPRVPNPDNEQWTLGPTRINALGYGFGTQGSSKTYARFLAGNYLGNKGPIFFTQAPAEPPGPPTDLSATSGINSIKVSFTAPTVASDAPITDIEYSTDDGATWKSASATSSPITISQLSASTAAVAFGTNYPIRIRAVNRGGEGTPSDPIAGTPGALPGKPTDVVAIQNGTSITVKWSPPDSDGGSAITSYLAQSVYNGTVFGDSPNCQSQSSGSEPPATECVMTVSNIANGTWTFKVKATTALGDGGFSDPVAAVTLPSSAPQINEGNSFSTPTGDISLSLQGINGTGYTAYVVTILPDSTTQECAYDYYASCVITGLTVGNEYTFTAAVKNDSGVGPASVESSAIKSVKTPDAPTQVSASPGNASVTVSWSAPKDTGGNAIVSYKAQVAGNPSAGSCTATAPATNCEISGLTNGVAYQFEVIANNGTHNSAPSNASAAVTPTAAGPASKLTIAVDGKLQSIDPQLKNLPFDVVVRLTDKDGNPVENEDAASVITLTASGGVDTTGKLAKVGALDQPVTASLAVGQSAVIITDLVYTGLSDTNGGDITLSASAASGLADGKSGTSAAFSVRDIKLTVTADDTSIVADGQSTATITVTLTDVNDAGQAGQNIRITTDKGKLFAGSAEVTETDVFATDAQGQVTFTLQSATTPGTATVTAFCPGACPSTLEVGFFSQQAVDDIASFDASSDEAPTPADYEKAGVTGVDNDSVDPINSVVDDLPTADRDTPEEIQVVADVVNEILDSADGEGTAPPDLDANDYAAIGLSDVDEAEEVSLMNTVIAEQTPVNLFPFAGLKGIAATVVDVIELADTGADPQLTVKRLSDVGLKSVNESTLTPIVNAIKEATPTDIDTLDKLQGVVDGVIDQVVATTIGAFDEDTSTAPPSTDDYADVGITGVTATNLTVVNSLVGSLPTADRDSSAEVQAVVDVVTEILAKADNDNTNLPDLSADDFATIGLSEVNTAEEVALMNAVLGSQPAANVSTASRLKAYASAVTRMIQTANGTLPPSAAPLTVEEFALLGIEGVTEENIDTVIELLAGQGSSAVTLNLLQAIADEARPALPVPTLNVWSMLLLMLTLLWLAQHQRFGVRRLR